MALDEDMLSELSPEQRSLALAMSEISEAAYCAGWMDGLEFALWCFLTTGRRKYGRSRVTDEEISRLRTLGEKCGGWIVYDDERQETFVASPIWDQMYAAGIAKHLPFIMDDSED